MSSEALPMTITRLPPSPCRCTRVSKSPISRQLLSGAVELDPPPAPHHVRAIGHLDRPRGVLLDEQDRHAFLAAAPGGSRTPGRRSRAPARVSARRGAEASGGQEAHARSRAAAARRPRASSRTCPSSCRSTGKRSSTSSMSLSTRAVLSRGRADLEVLADGEAAEDPTALRNERDPRTQDLVG